MMFRAENSWESLSWTRFPYFEGLWGTRALFFVPLTILTIWPGFILVNISRNVGSIQKWSLPHSKFSQTKVETVLFAHCTY